jgi:hypothetical protein
MIKKGDRIMTAIELTQCAQEGFTRLSKLPVSAVIGLAKKDDVWMVSLEALERKAIPETMDVLGVYEIRLDNDGTLLGFERKKLRNRGKTDDAA